MKLTVTLFFEDADAGLGKGQEETVLTGASVNYHDAAGSANWLTAEQLDDPAFAVNGMTLRELGAKIRDDVLGATKGAPRYTRSDVESAPTEELSAALAIVSTSKASGVATADLVAAALESANAKSSKAAAVSP